MKKFLSLLACTALFFGVLPVTAPPARAITSFTVSANTAACFVGDRITWEINHMQDWGGYFNCTFDVYKDGKSYSRLIWNKWFFNNYDFYPTAPGVYKVHITMYDAYYDDYADAFSKSTVVYAILPNRVTSVEAVSGTSLKITWNKLPGASGYELCRSTSKTGTYKPVKSTTATTYTNTYLTAGTRYFYKVRAYTMEGGVKKYGSFSAALGGVPLAKSAIVSAAGVSETQVKLTWKKVTGATGYQVFRSATAGGTYKLIKTTTALTYTAGGLQHAKTYYFKVRPYKKIYTNTYYGPLSAYRAGRTK